MKNVFKDTSRQIAALSCLLCLLFASGCNKTVITEVKTDNNKQIEATEKEEEKREEKGKEEEETKQEEKNDYYVEDNKEGNAYSSEQEDGIGDSNKKEDSSKIVLKKPYRNYGKMYNEDMDREEVEQTKEIGSMGDILKKKELTEEEQHKLIEAYNRNIKIISNSAIQFTYAKKIGEREREEIYHIKDILEALKKWKDGKPINEEEQELFEHRKESYEIREKLIEGIYFSGIVLVNTVQSEEDYNNTHKIEIEIVLNQLKRNIENIEYINKRIKKLYEDNDKLVSTWKELYKQLYRYRKILNNITTVEELEDNRQDLLKLEIGNLIAEMEKQLKKEIGGYTEGMSMRDMFIGNKAGEEDEK